MDSVAWWAWLGYGAVVTLLIVALIRAHHDRRALRWRLGRYLGEK
jgi:hypothetical protein